VPEFEKSIREFRAPQDLKAAWNAFGRLHSLCSTLLAIHRWSLTHADLFYTLLRRHLKRWFDPESAGRLAAQLTAGFPNKSVELNRALQSVRTEADWQYFMDAFGHRSFSLDIIQPAFAEESEPVRALLAVRADQCARAQTASLRDKAERELRHAAAGRPWRWIQWPLLRTVLAYSRRYMVLREDQRFYWQKALSLQRGLALQAGRCFTEDGRLACPEDIFFAALEEVERAVRGAELPVREIARRKFEFRRLEQQYERDPGLSYPAFLRGNDPLPQDTAGPAGLLHGLPVSPGAARGPARLITSPRGFDRIKSGDILVTRTADPGWTPVYERLAGLVLEVGGQLSHGAVVAREYGLPAVAGVGGAIRLLKDGQEITVDGDRGTVRFDYETASIP
jgi:pyruvate,water dikinase